MNRCKGVSLAQIAWIGIFVRHSYADAVAATLTLVQPE